MEVKYIHKEQPLHVCIDVAQGNNNNNNDNTLYIHHDDGDKR